MNTFSFMSLSLPSFVVAVEEGVGRKHPASWSGGRRDEGVERELSLLALPVSSGLRTSSVAPSLAKLWGKQGTMLSCLPPVVGCPCVCV